MIENVKKYLKPGVTVPFDMTTMRELAMIAKDYQENLHKLLDQLDLVVKKYEDALVDHTFNMSDAKALDYMEQWDDLVDLIAEIKEKL